MKQSLYAILLLFIFGCSNHPGADKSETGSNTETSDTSLFFLINGTSKEFRVNKDNVNLIHDLGKFQEWIDEYEKNPEHSLKKSLEITGEGSGNTIYSSLKKQKDGFLVKHSIYQHDTLIWQDSLLIDDNVSYNWENDPLFYKLKPYSTFYFACIYADYFINDPIEVSSESFRENYLNIPNEPDTAYWADYLRRFKGRTIAKLALEDGGDWIWDVRRRKFIDFFEP